MRREFERSFSAAIAGRALLDHPFYQRWQDGELSVAELAAYAEQYRHFERVLPEILAAAATRLPAGEAREYVLANLTDERSRPRPHVELFEQFAAAVGATPEAPATPATENLVGLYRSAVEFGPGQALSVIGAYEVQAADVATTKAESLRLQYRLGTEGTAFWDVHADMERNHAGWTVDALVALDEPRPVVDEYAAASANAWWAFLDGRSSMAEALAG